ncbi:hypothetical protein OROHE_002479 [Orobanche hederae]
MGEGSKMLSVEQALEIVLEVARRLPPVTVRCPYTRRWAKSWPKTWPHPTRFHYTLLLSSNTKSKATGEESTDDGEGEEAMEEKDVAGEEIKGSADMDTKEAVDEEAVTEESIPKKPDTENAEMKMENEEPFAVGTENDANTVVEGAEIEESKEGSNAEEIQDGKVDCGDFVLLIYG